MELQDYLVDCTVRVESRAGVGTGFFIARDLVVVPARLVESITQDRFPLLEDIRIRFQGRVHAAKTVRYASSPNPDLAILQTRVGKHSTAFLYAPVRSDDPLFVCGVPEEPGDEIERLVFEGAQIDGNLLRMASSTARLSITGAPVLNLRTGGVCAIVRRRSSTDPTLLVATSTSLIDTFFPGVRDTHDDHHEAEPGWFETSGVSGTVFAARQHLVAMHEACQEPIQPLLSPEGDLGAVDLMAPVTMKVLTEDRLERRPANLADLAFQCSVDGPGIIVAGASGSGRSSVLRHLVHTAANRARCLGARGQDLLFPILIRANQLASREGSIEERILNAIRGSRGAVGQTLLPSTFLTDLVECSGLRLLIMIDGVDEIQNSRDLAEIVDVVGQIRNDPGFGEKTRLVVTLKPTSIEHFRYSGFEVYEIQPLAVSAIHEGARRWLGSAADRFIEDNAHLVGSGILSSPLALSIALKLYERHARGLAPRLVDLYHELVDMAVAEWRQRPNIDRYGPEIIDHAVDVLGFMALELLRSATVQDKPWVVQSVTRYFIQHLKLAPEAASELALRFTDFASDDSLFLRPAGDRLYWSHLSFQDYFAALRLTRAPEEAGNALKAIRSRWFDANRGNAPAFATALLSSDAERTEIVREILSSGRPERLDFVCGLILDGAQLPDDLEQVLMDQLRTRAASEREEYGTMLRPSPRVSFAFDLLFSLRHLDSARAILASIADDRDWPNQIREQARLEAVTH